MSKEYVEVKSVNDLVYNEPVKLVSVFKDFLILDDINEFLKRPYTCNEQPTRFDRLTRFYEKNLIENQVYPGWSGLGDQKPRTHPCPNYAALLPEPACFIFKNVERR